MDAICRQRGATAGSLTDSVVNQLLACLDGVNKLDNLLVIGMTNRLDLIDKAMLRPGRFEVHIDVGLPTEAGRLQILIIHTSTMQAKGLLHKDVDLADISKKTMNFTGAELEALVKCAVSHAMLRHPGLTDFSVRRLSSATPVNKQDF